MAQIRTDIHRYARSLPTYGAHSRPVMSLVFNTIVEYASIAGDTNMLFQLRRCVGLCRQQMQLKTRKQSLP
jgi:hypothetical protein